MLLLRSSLNDGDLSFYPSATVTGPLEKGIEALLDQDRKKEWARVTFCDYRSDFNERIRLGSSEITSETLIRAAVSAAPGKTRLCVDVGAHMFSPMPSCLLCGCMTC